MNVIIKKKNNKKPFVLDANIITLDVVLLADDEILDSYKVIQDN